MSKYLSTSISILFSALMRGGHSTKRLRLELDATVENFVIKYHMCWYDQMAFADYRVVLDRITKVCSRYTVMLTIAHPWSQAAFLIVDALIESYRTDCGTDCTTRMSSLLLSSPIRKHLTSLKGQSENLEHSTGSYIATSRWQQPHQQCANERSASD